LNFFLFFIFRVRQANIGRIAGVVDTAKKLIAGSVDTGEQFFGGVDSGNKF
jgi:hypothetical protein